MFAQSKASAPAMKPEELDVLLGPVALYPDALLAQILLCAQKPTQVTRLAQWLPVNKLTGTELQDAATVDGFDPEFVAVTLFPTVVTYMTRTWTGRPSWAKRSPPNKSAVFDSIQRLRGKAQKAGALKDSPQQNVETKTTDGRAAGDRYRAGKSAGHLRPPVQPDRGVRGPHPDGRGRRRTTALMPPSRADWLHSRHRDWRRMDNDYYYGPYGWHGGAYMYNDAWDDYYDAREDARETGRIIAKISSRSAASDGRTRRSSAPTGRRTAPRTGPRAPRSVSRTRSRRSRRGPTIRRPGRRSRHRDTVDDAQHDGRQQ